MSEHIIKRLEAVKSSKDARTLLTNFFSLSLLQVASYAFSLLTLPYLTRVIGAEKFGEMAFASAVVVYFQTLVDYGFIFSAVRDIARCREDKEQVSFIYSNVMWARFMLTGVSFLLLCTLIVLIPKMYDMRLILLLTFLLVPGHAMFPDWMFQALEKMKYITVFNVIVKFLFTIAVFVFIRQRSDYILQPVLIAAGYLISGIASMWLIHHWGIHLQRPDIHRIWQAIKSNTDLFINQLVPNLYNSLSVLILGFTHGSFANGIYAAGGKFNDIAGQLANIISRTFYPFLSRRGEKHGVFARINLSVSVIMASVLFIFAPLLIRLFFGCEYLQAIPVMRILSVSLIFLAIGNTYGTNGLILKGYEKETRQMTLLASVTGFVIAFPLIHFFSYIGVALTVAFTRGLLALLYYVEGKRLENRNGGGNSLEYYSIFVYAKPVYNHHERTITLATAYGRD